MQCPSCHSDVPPESRFCSGCGAPVPSDVLPTMTAPSVETPATPSGSSVDGRFAVGSVFAGRYRILGALGRGGMGEVYRAHDSKLDQEVALKFLPESARDPAQLERFRTEVRVARQVSHPNVCRVYDMGEVDGVRFISMEYVDGEDLQSLLRRIGRLPGDKAVEMARRLCAGVAAAHSVGVLHRDLKPANIMLDGQGQVHIMDFGLADLAERVQGHDIRSGTPAYMAPEQAEGREVTPRSDIYSLGLVLFEIFTGQKALGENGDRSSHPSASQTAADVDPAVAKVIERCLEPDPSHRPQSALDVARALPGGDPLAEALAAGDTPSPEMVAASDETGVLSVRAAVGCLVMIAVSLTSVFVLNSRTHVLTLGPAPDSAEALANDARRLAERLGHGGSIADRGYDFEYDVALDTWSASNDVEPADLRATIARGGLAPVTFWYRQSPEPLLPVNARANLTPDDPASTIPGMVTIRLDLAGRLRSLLAVPSGLARDSAPSSVFDELLDAAGFDPATECTPTEVTLTPPVAYTGEPAAWTCVYPEAPDIEMQVAAAVLGATPIYFEVRGPWWEASRPAAGTVPAGWFVLIMLGGGALLARFNHQRGRGDFQGAMRLATFGFVAASIDVFLTAHNPFVAILDDVRAQQGMRMVSLGLFIGAVLWVFYVALEPFVRRRSPHSLISWRRLLGGRWRDPVVGGHILVGAAAGAALAVVCCLTEPVGTMLPILLPPPGALSGVAPSVAMGAYLIGSSAGISLLLFLAYSLLRVILRNPWLSIAAVFVFLAFTSPFADNPRLPLAVLVLTNACIVGAAVFLVWRFGVLSLVVLVLVLRTLVMAPMVADFSAWYSHVTIMALVIVLGLTAWSFQAALGGRSLVREGFLES